MWMILFFVLFHSVKSEIPAKIIYSSSQDDFNHPIYFRYGTSVTFSCIAEGSPPPVYKWFRNDRLVIINENVKRITLNNGNLTIRELEHSLDDGTYQCLAFNDYGSDVSHPLQFRTQVIGEFLSTEKENEDIKGTIGETLLIPCPESSYFYPKIFDWTYHSDIMRIKPLAQDHRVNILKNGTLFFSHLTDDDVNKINNRGGIQCVIFSGNEMTRSKAFRINPVTVGQENDFAPYFLEQISGQLITRIDSIIQLQCSAAGRPAPDIRWYHNSKLIDDNMFGYKPLHNHLMLEINVLSVDFGGEYMCKVNNTVDGKENILKASQDIIVDRKPHWLIEPQDQYIPPGGHLHVFCLARGIPRPTHQWYLDGVKVPSPHDINGTNMTDGILEIPNARGVHEYECRASNEFGEISKKIVVTAIVTTTTTTTTSPEIAAKPRDLMGSSSNVCKISVILNYYFILIYFLAFLYSWNIIY